MDLNKNIKSIIYKYYTYSNDQIEEFSIEWKKDMKNVNKFFNINFADYQKDCYMCKVKNHRNCDCPKFYSTLHFINTIVDSKMKN